jgi:hypothetical protein
MKTRGSNGRVLGRQAAQVAIPQGFPTSVSAIRTCPVFISAQFRSGQLDNKAHQQRLGQARAKLKARQCEIWRREEVFFKSTFPMIVPVGTRNDVLSLLRAAG